MDLPKVNCIFCGDKNPKCTYCGGNRNKIIKIYDPVLPPMTTAKAILGNEHLPMIDEAVFENGELTLNIQNLYDTFNIIKIVSREGKLCFLDHEDKIIPWEPIKTE